MSRENVAHKMLEELTRNDAKGREEGEMVIR